MFVMPKMPWWVWAIMGGCLLGVILSSDPDTRMFFGMFLFVLVIIAAKQGPLWIYVRERKMVFQKLFSSKSGSDVKVVICSIPMITLAEGSNISPYLYLAEIIAVKTGKDKPSMFSGLRQNFNPVTKPLFATKMPMDQEYTDYFDQLDLLMRTYEIASIRKLGGIGDIAIQEQELYPGLKMMGSSKGIKVERIKVDFKDFFMKYKPQKKFSDREIE